MTFMETDNGYIKMDNHMNQAANSRTRCEQIKCCCLACLCCLCILSILVVAYYMLYSELYLMQTETYSL